MLLTLQTHYKTPTSHYNIFIADLINKISILWALERFLIFLIISKRRKSTTKCLKSPMVSMFARVGKFHYTHYTPLWKYHKMAL